jgi:hypothetical protein
MTKQRSINDVKEINIGIYELNTRLAKALNLHHKEQLDRIDHFYSFEGVWERWDERSIHIRLHHKERLQEIDFTKRVDLLLSYCASYGIDIISSEDKPKVKLSFKGEFEPKELTGDSFIFLMIDAIMLHCKTLEIKEMQSLNPDYMTML